MKLIKLKLLVAAGAVALMTLGGVTAASADTGGVAACSGGRTLGTTSRSGVGPVAHVQVSAGVTWTKEWNNTAYTNRYYNKGLTGSISWGIAANILTIATGACEA